MGTCCGTTAEDTGATAWTALAAAWVEAGLTEALATEEAGGAAGGAAAAGDRTAAAELTMVNVGAGPGSAPAAICPVLLGADGTAGNSFAARGAVVDLAVAAGLGLLAWASTPVGEVDVAPAAALA
jgi:hypothetical protein